MLQYYGCKRNAFCATACHATPKEKYFHPCLTCDKVLLLFFTPNHAQPPLL